MARQPKYSKEEHARRGQVRYEEIRAKLEAEDYGRIVALDVDSDAFELAPDTLTAADSLLARCPDAQIWFARVGYPGVHRFGARAAKTP
jgi:hypothetical protein